MLGQCTKCGTWEVFNLINTVLDSTNYIFKCNVTNIAQWKICIKVKIKLSAKNTNKRFPYVKKLFRWNDLTAELHGGWVTFSVYSFFIYLHTVNKILYYYA